LKRGDPRVVARKPISTRILREDDTITAIQGKEEEGTKGKGGELERLTNELLQKRVGIVPMKKGNRHLAYQTEEATQEEKSQKNRIP